MELTQEDFANGHNIVNESIKMNETDFEIYLKTEINNFIANSDMGDLQNRKKVREFLSHLSTLYLNKMVNTKLYLLVEEKLAKKGREIILEYLTKFIKEGIYESRN